VSCAIIGLPDADGGGGECAGRPTLRDLPARRSALEEGTRPRNLASRTIKERLEAWDLGLGTTDDGTTIGLFPAGSHALTGVGLVAHPGALDEDQAMSIVSLCLLALLAAGAEPAAEKPAAAAVSDRRWRRWPRRSTERAGSPSRPVSQGRLDLFLMKPDGSKLRNITSSPSSTRPARFSADGKKLLWRRIPREETYDGNRHGMQGALVIAAGDGSGAEVMGKDGELPWASWSPDGKSVATLALKGISIIDLARAGDPAPRSKGILPAAHLVAGRELALRGGQFVRHRLVDRPDRGQERRGEPGEQGDLLHA